MPERGSFSLVEARDLWARLLAGWADHLDPSGARLLIDGHPNSQDAGGSYEGVTRMLWGLGGWPRPERAAVVEWRGRQYDLEALTRRALLAGTDPEGDGYWGTPLDTNGSRQRIVEAGQVAFAVWQTRDRIWNRFDPDERERIVTWLDRCGRRPDRWNNNWALFWALNHACRRALDVRHDPDLIADVLTWLDDVYCGDGWYDDGPSTGTNHFDDYNWWVFGSHVLAWAEVDGASLPGRRDELLERVRKAMTHYPAFFAADGAYPEYGRSLSYKFARLGAPLWAYKLGVWPHEPGMLRRLVGRHLRWYVDRGAIRADGSLRQELTRDGHPDIRETYISTGATYWAMQVFGGLWSLADDDPFWTTDEAPLPVELASFTRSYSQPGWLVVGDADSGHVARYNAHSGGTAAKYGKFVYSTAAPFNVGMVGGHSSPDAMVCLTGPNEIGHRTTTMASAIGDRWIRMRHAQRIGGAEHVIETVIVVAGALHLRAHRIRIGATGVPIGAIEGASALGFPSGGYVDIAPTGDMISSASAEGITSTIRGVSGYSRAHRPGLFAADRTLNSVSANYVLPSLAVDQVTDGHELVAICALGRHAEAEGAATVTWAQDGDVVVDWPAFGEAIVIARIA